MKKLLLILVGFALTLGGCASMRKVEVGSDAGTNYAVSVTNARASSVTISYVDDGRTIELGTVSAGGNQRFVLGTSAVELVAKTASGTVVGRYNLALTSGSTSTVTVR